MGQQPGQTGSQPVSFDQERATRALQQFQTASAAATQQNGTMRNRSFIAGRPAPGFNELMNFYMQSAAGPTPPPAAPPVPTAFQQFRSDRAAGIGPVRRTAQYTPPAGPRMARDNRVAGDMA